MATKAMPFLLFCVLSLCVITGNAGSPPLGDAAFAPSTASPVGFRGDGSGCFPGAVPPTVWNLTTKEGVVWAADMPGKASGSPVVVGNRVLTTADPDLVIAVDAATGKELWRHKADALDLVPAAERKELSVKATAALARIAAAKKAIAEFVPTKDIDMDSPQAPVNKGVLDEELKNAMKDVQALNAKAMVIPDESFAQFGGPACATPASDGQVVVAQFGGGALVCCDLEGNRRWMAMARGFGWSMVGESPVIVGDRVYAIKGQRGGPTAAAYNLKDGSVAWEKIVSNPDHGGSGSLVLVKTAAGARLVWSGGEILDPANGDIVKFESSSDMGSSVAPGGVGQFFAQCGDYHSKPKLVGLQVGADGQASTLFALPRPGKRHAGFASSLFYDGLLYTRTSGGKSVADLEIVDVKAGAISLHPQKFGGDELWFTPSPTLAGSLIFVMTGDGTTTILKPGIKPEVVAVQALEPMGNSPYFQGNRMYVRTVNRLICIGPR